MAKYSISEIYDAALAAGFSREQATTWTAIAMAESGGQTSALNDQGEHSMGLWQINVNPRVRANHWGDLNDPRVNARAAYEVSRHGTDMRPWTTTHDVNKGTAHDYRTYLDDVESVVGVKGDWRGVTGYGAPLPTPLTPQGAEHAAAPSHAAVPAYDQVPAGRSPGEQRDTDGDGLVDEFERLAGTRADLADTDRDGVPDGFEVAVSHSDPRSADSDHDGLSDAVEVSLGTDPTAIDTDHDGITDRAEVELGSDPLVPDAGTGLAAPSATAARPLAAAVPLAVGADVPSPVPAFDPVPSAAPAPAPIPSAPHAVRESKADRFVDVAVGQRGDRYIYGAEARLSDRDPDAFDCSELTQWAAHQVGVTIPDGAEYQYLDLKSKGSLLPVDQALRTKGALLFYFSQEPTATGPRPSRAHVAISLGDGRTIEARGRAYGVNEFAAEHRFNYAGVVPGLGAPADPQPAPTPEPTHPAPPPPGYDTMLAGVAPDHAKDTDGDGLLDDFERLAGTRVDSVDSDHDGLPDAVEALRTHTDPLSADTDHDGVPDAVEVAMGSDAGRLPGVAGVVGQGVFAQNVRTPVVDTDHDGISDVVERRLGLDPKSADSDRDTLPDALEVALGTSGTQVDTDHDGMADGMEVRLGTDPLHAGGLPPGLIPALTEGVAAPVGHDPVLDALDGALPGGDHDGGP